MGKLYSTELDLKTVWKKDTDFHSGLLLQEASCWPALGTSTSAFYIWGPGTQGWGLR